MDKERELNRLFHLSSLITDVFPKRGAQALDLAVRGLLGNIVLLKTFEHQVRKTLRNVTRIKRILVTADLNIGDAIIAQGAVSALREIFPKAIVDCVVKKSAEGLIYGNPEISTLFPLYEGAPFPLDSDLEGLSRISGEGRYDVVINFSPMVDDVVFGRNNVVNYSMMAAELIRNESRGPKVINNVVFQSHNFIGEIFCDFLPQDFGAKFRGASVYLSDDSLREAGDFLEAGGVSQENPIVMINPDASAKFTRMPFDFQLALLRNFAEHDCSILLGAGHVEKLIEHELIFSLSPEHRRKITIIPASTKLDTYAALTDRSDVFISGDTGPLHLAAARKFSRSSGSSLRNTTAVLSVFGGTPSRIYGYDSSVPGYFAANQDAPSRTFVAETQCRNITCINKMAKTCRQVRCFQSLDPSDVVQVASRYMESSRRKISRDRLRILVK